MSLGLLSPAVSEEVVRLGGCIPPKGLGCDSRHGDFARPSECWGRLECIATAHLPPHPSAPPRGLALQLGCGTPYAKGIRQVKAAVLDRDRISLRGEAGGPHTLKALEHSGKLDCLFPSQFACRPPRPWASSLPTHSFYKFPTLLTRGSPCTSSPLSPRPLAGQLDQGLSRGNAIALITL